MKSSLLYLTLAPFFIGIIAKPPIMPILSKVIPTKFFAPSPDGPIPMHVLRRIMRFCSENPTHKECLGHPEWIVAGGLPEPPNVGKWVNKKTKNEKDFPKWKETAIPAVPQLGTKDLLANVPEGLKEVLKNSPRFKNIKAKLEDEKAKIEKVCERLGNCKQQKPENLNRRASIAEAESAIREAIDPRCKHATNATQGDVDATAIECPPEVVQQIDADIEARMTRTYQVKKALLERVGLGDIVEPANDGVYEEDILLTVEQADILINQIKENRPGFGVVPTSPVAGGEESGRAKRAGNSLFLETFTANRWKTFPIPFYFDGSFTPTQKSYVRSAVTEIESKTCVRFSEVTANPNKDHMYFVKSTDPTYCGLSSVGRVNNPPNIIYLTLRTSCPNPMGVAAHEILHALGVSHEQVRPDREEYLTINWDNVDPDKTDTLNTKSDTTYTSYGVKYDYGSILHYNRYTASRSGGQTLTANVDPEVNDPTMGQRDGLSDYDVEVINKMYCKPADCVDTDVYCGTWALWGNCEGEWHDYMQDNCAKSCNFC